MFSWLRNFFIGRPLEQTPELITTEFKSIVVDVPKSTEDEKHPPINEKDLIQNNENSNLNQRNMTKTVTKKTKGRPKKNG